MAAEVLKWDGRHIPTLRDTPHGAELIAAAKAHLSDEAAQAEVRLIQELVQTLSRALDSVSPSVITDKAMTLMYASKGLLMTAETVDHFQEGMKPVIRTVLNS